MKLDRNHVQGDLTQKSFKSIVEYTLSREEKHIIPIVHIKTHQGKLCLMKKMDSVWPISAHLSSLSIIITPWQTCSTVRKYSKSLNFGLCLRVCWVSLRDSKKTTLQSI